MGKQHDVRRPALRHAGRRATNILRPALAGPFDFDRDRATVARANREVGSRVALSRLDDHAIEGRREDPLPARFYCHKVFYCTSRIEG